LLFAYHECFLFQVFLYLVDNVICNDTCVRILLKRIATRWQNEMMIAALIWMIANKAALDQVAIQVGDLMCVF
jgi:hypothetical protein